MWILLVLIGIGLYIAIDSSSRNHSQEWRDRQPPNGHKVYPGTFDLGEIVGCIVLAIIILVVVSNLSGGR